MILLDDAGWGCLIGGVLIGAYRKETCEYLSMEVPVESFQKGSFKEKKYLAAAGAIAIQLLEKLNVSKSEPIMICTGYCLDGIAEELSNREYNFTRGKITGPLQFKIEKELRTTLLDKYNFKVSYDVLTELNKKGLFWWNQISWLKNGDVEKKGADKSRIPLCKTGWATFDVWAKYPYSEAKELASHLKDSLKHARRRF